MNAPPPARHSPAEPAPRDSQEKNVEVVVQADNLEKQFPVVLWGDNSEKKNPVVLWGDNCLKFQRTCPAEPRLPGMEARS